MDTMATREPAATLDARFSSPGAKPHPWDAARATVAGAELYWLATVRADGRPHITPLLGIWMDERLHFCTGPDEQKAKNLGGNDHCALLTGANVSDGFDVVVEGRAVRVTDDGTLRRLADAYLAKYGEDWRFTVDDGAFRHGDDSLRGDDPGRAIVFTVEPENALGFGKGAVYSQTRYRFGG
jgi:general stress protein 26